MYFHVGYDSHNNIILIKMQDWENVAWNNVFRGSRNTNISEIPVY
jgi:hypothetical protein